MDVNTATITIGDVVFCNDVGAIVVACALDAGEPFLMVDVMPLRRAISDHSVQLDTVDMMPATWRPTSVRLALAWYSRFNLWVSNSCRGGFKIVFRS